MSQKKTQNISLGMKSILAVICVIAVFVLCISLNSVFKSQQQLVNQLLSLDKQTLTSLSSSFKYGISDGVDLQSNHKVLSPKIAALKNKLQQVGIVLIDTDAKLEIQRQKKVVNKAIPISFEQQIFRDNGLLFVKENIVYILLSSYYFWLFFLLSSLTFTTVLKTYRRNSISSDSQHELIKWADEVIDKKATAHVPSNFRIGKAIEIIQKQLLKAQQADSNFDQQLRNRTLLDAVTGIGNRQYFNNCLEAYLLEEDAQGTVLLIQLQDADLIAGLYGEEVLDKLLKSITETIEHRVTGVGHAILARQSEFEFSILLPQLLPKEASKLSARLLDNLNNLPLPVGVNAEQFFHIGLNCFDSPQDSYQVMAEADMALRTAQLQGPSQWFMFESGEVGRQIAKGSLKWRTFLENVAKHQKFVLFYQPLVSLIDSRVIHHEILAKVRDEDGQLINAKIFLPMARKAGVSVEVDKTILLQTFQLITQQLNIQGQSHQQTVEHRSLNLSVESMLSVEFHNFFFDLIEQEKQMLTFLNLEISEYQLVAHLTELKPFLDGLKLRNVRLLVDKVGQYVVSAKYLDSYPFTGIKLHRSIVSNVQEKTENQLVISSLKVLCDSKNIEVFAHGIESKQELTALINLGVAAGQGHFFISPVQDT